MTQEELREQIDKIGRAIQSLPYGEQDDRFYHEEIDALEALIEREKKAAVERALTMAFDLLKREGRISPASSKEGTWESIFCTTLANVLDFPPSK